MLAANSWVGEMLTEKNIPGLFRVHPLPDSEKVLDFSEMMAATFGFYPGDLTSREACNAFIEKLPDDEKKPIILGLFLRSLPRAFYQASPDLHFGLGKGRYTHFTSPIRRYTDLAVHQQLWNCDTNQRLKPKDTFAKLGLDLSEKEENNDNAYYAASDRLKLRYLQELLEKSALNFYEGIISKISSAAVVASSVVSSDSAVSSALRIYRATSTEPPKVSVLKEAANVSKSEITSRFVCMKSILSAAPLTSNSQTERGFYEKQIYTFSAPSDRYSCRRPPRRLRLVKITQTSRFNSARFHLCQRTETDENKCRPH